MKNTKTLTRVALLVAIELVMKMVGLGSVPVGPLYMSFLTLPIAVGAITMGPAVGALLGGRVEFREDENTTTDLMDGKLYFHVYMTPPAAARDIEFVQEYDPEYISTLFA